MQGTTIMEQYCTFKSNNIRKEW